MLLQMALFYSFSWFSNIPLHHIFFIHSSADGHLGCFHVLTIVNMETQKISSTQSNLEIEKHSWRNQAPWPSISCDTVVCMPQEPSWQALNSIGCPHCSWLSSSAQHCDLDCHALDPVILALACPFKICSCLAGHVLACSQLMTLMSWGSPIADDVLLVFKHQPSKNILKVFA